MTAGKPVKTLVKINDVDVATSLLSWDSNPSRGDKAKAIAITLRRNVYSLVPLLETAPRNLTLTVQRGVTAATESYVFRGTVQQRVSQGGVITIIGRDKLFKATQKNITRTFNKNIDTEAGKISEIWTTLATTAGITTDSTSVQDSGTAIVLDTFVCNNADVLERQERLEELLQWQGYYSSLDDLGHFEPKGARAGTNTLTVGNNIVNRPRWDRDGSQVIEKAILFGGPVETKETTTTVASASQTDFTLAHIPVSIRVTVDGTEKDGGLEDQSPAADYFVDGPNKIVRFSVAMAGSESVVIENSFLSPLVISGGNPVSDAMETRIDKEDIVKVEDAVQYLNKYLAKYSVDFLKTKLQVTNITDIEPGQTLTVIDTNENINQEFMVTKIRRQFPYVFDEVEVDTEHLTIEDWDVNVEDRIRRIEEKLTQEQTLVIHVRPGNRTIKIGREWFMAQKRDITGTDKLYWNNPSFGTWNSFKWSDTEAGSLVLAYFSQGGDIYIEDFLNIDFKAGATTATWTTTGSMSFTSGQNATSDEIDFNNGTITQVLLTSIETSGTFLYEVTANGGTNWETVSSGILYTFTNTGTDLRWRVTENAASTGEISEIKMEQYH